MSGTFDVDEAISNFHLNCDLEAKPDVAGYGHWHLNLATTVIHASTSGLKAGQTHTTIALPVDTYHAPLHPLAEAKMNVKIG